jgi:hypothetical protein
MRHHALCSFVVLLAAASVAEAQPRVYAGTSTAVDGGTRGNIPGGAVPSAGALFGVQLSEAWGIELEVERAFRTTTAGSGEAVLLSYPPTLTPTREEIERYGIRTRDERTQEAGAGWAAHAVWRTREPGRVNVGLLTGVASRLYTTHLVRTTTFVSPLITLAPGYRLPDETSSRRMIGTGLDGGLVFFIRVAGQLVVAPEFRYTYGMITDDRYHVGRAGVRVLWEF